MIKQSQQAALDTPVGVVTFITDLAGVIKDVNSDIGNSLGFGKEQLAGRLISEAVTLICDDSLPGEGFDRVLNTVVIGKACQLQYPDGSMLPVMMSVMPYRRYGQAPINIISFQEHSSDSNTVIELQEKPAAMQSRASQLLYRTIIESLQDYFVLVDKDHRVQMINKSYALMVGASEESLVGKKVQDLWGFDKPAELYYGACQKAYAGSSGEFEFWADLPGDKGMAYLNVSYYPVFDGDDIVSLAFLTKDITVRKKAQERAENSERFLRGAQKSAEIGFWRVNLESQHIKFSETFIELLGISEQAMAMPVKFDSVLKNYVHPEDYEAQRRYFTDAFSVDQPFTTEFRVVLEGAVKYMSVHGDAVHDDSGRIIKFMGSIRDVTGEVSSRQALAESEERYRLLYDDNPVMCFTVDQHGQIQQVNSYCAIHLGFDVAALLQKPFVSIIHDEDTSLVEDAFSYCFDSPQEVNSWEIRMVSKSGDILWTRDTAKVVIDSHGEKSLLIVAHDITENYKLSQQLVYYASHDSLTGLINRREFEHRVQTTLDLAHVEDSQHALFYLDLDQFKIINDTSGHMAGDELLVQICRVISDSVREQDAVARLGGDEFGVLLQYCSLEKAAKIAEEIRHKIECYAFDWEDKNYNVRVSIGVAAVTRESAGIVDILRQADNACYAAKDAGKNKVHIYHSDDVEVTRLTSQLQWVSILERALINDSFKLYAQTIAEGCEQAGAERLRYEVLLRGVDAAGNIVAPGAFLPTAERYHIADRLDIWVVDKVLDFLEQNPRHLERLSSCSINLSGRSFVSEKFSAFLLQRLKSSFVPGEKICFEITETAAIENLRLARVFIEKLKGLGCLIALDDFGSGLSSFGYLRSLPVDYLKIDGMFVKGIVDEPIDYAMVKSINEIGKVMGKQTVAEFVENEEIAEKLRALGVDYLQGYYIGKPQPIEGLVFP